MKTLGRLAVLLSILTFGCAPSATTEEKLENAATSAGEAVEDAAAAGESAVEDAANAVDEAVDTTSDEG